MASAILACVAEAPSAVPDLSRLVELIVTALVAVPSPMVKALDLPLDRSMDPAGTPCAVCGGLAVAAAPMLRPAASVSGGERHGAAGAEALRGESQLVGDIIGGRDVDAGGVELPLDRLFEFDLGRRRADRISGLSRLAELIETVVEVGAVPDREGVGGAAQRGPGRSRPPFRLPSRPPGCWWTGGGGGVGGAVSVLAVPRPRPIVSEAVPDLIVGAAVTSSGPVKVSWFVVLSMWRSTSSPTVPC